MSDRNGSPASWPQLWLDHEASGAPRGDLFQSPRNTARFVRVKPEGGGFWTSPLRPDGACGWIEWLAFEDWWPHDGRDPPVYLLEPDPAARVLTISSLADLEAVIAMFPWVAEEPLGFADRGINFEAAASAGYDAIHLTEAGQWATRMTDPSLYGWDCESVLWLRWRFVHARAYERSAAELARLVLDADAATEASA